MYRIEPALFLCQNLQINVHKVKKNRILLSDLQVKTSFDATIIVESVLLLDSCWLPPANYFYTPIGDGL